MAKDKQKLQTIKKVNRLLNLRRSKRAIIKNKAKNFKNKRMICFKRRIKTYDDLYRLCQSAGILEIGIQAMKNITKYIKSSKHKLENRTSYFIDVGCAMGSFCKYIKGHYHRCMVKGIEVDNKVAKYAKDNLNSYCIDIVNVDIMNVCSFEKCTHLFCMNSSFPEKTNMNIIEKINRCCSIKMLIWNKAIKYTKTYLPQFQFDKRLQIRFGNSSRTIYFYSINT